VEYVAVYCAAIRYAVIRSEVTDASSRSRPLGARVWSAWVVGRVYSITKRLTACSVRA